MQLNLYRLLKKCMVFNCINVFHSNVRKTFQLSHPNFDYKRNFEYAVTTTLFYFSLDSIVRIQ